jgi:hypothetical protein
MQVKVCCWNDEMQTTAADCEVSLWYTSSAYGLELGVLLENDHLENLKGYERVTLGEFLLK